MKTLVCVMAAVALTAPAPMLAQSSADEVRTAVAGIYAALDSADVDAVMQYMMDGGYTEITADGRSVVIDEAFLRRVLVPGLRANLRAEDVDVRLYGEAALVTGVRVGGVLRAAAPPPDDRLRLTMLWARDAGRWKLVHLHLSPVPDGL